jgi:SAM-dependent methyltransferase
LEQAQLLKRFFKMMKQSIAGFRHSLLIFYRRLWHTFRFFILEKPRGLDFHPRNKKIKKESGGKNQGYAITPESHLKQIFATLDITNKNNFIDIGCGKGYVLTKAAKQPYNKITGIDFIPKMAHIAQKNISILRLKDRINLCFADVASYDYDEYDHLFLYNPFSSDILESVVSRIIESLERRPRDLIIIYFHPSDHYVFMESGYFEIIQVLHCFVKDYETFIYRNIKSTDQPQDSSERTVLKEKEILCQKKIY